MKMIGEDFDDEVLEDNAVPDGNILQPMRGSSFAKRMSSKRRSLSSSTNNLDGLASPKANPLLTMEDVDPYSKKPARWVKNDFGSDFYSSYWMKCIDEVLKSDVIWEVNFLDLKS